MTTNNETQWKLMPADPTQEMAVAAISARLNNPESVYRAMWAAAPQPPAQPEYEMRESTREEMLRDWQQLGAKLFWGQPASGERAELAATLRKSAEVSGSHHQQADWQRIAQREAAALLEADAQLGLDNADLREQNKSLIDGTMALAAEIRRLEADAQRPAMNPLTEATAVGFLRDLVTALDGAFISSWQSTAKWQTELDNAREYLAHNIKEQS